MSQRLRQGIAFAPVQPVNWCAALHPYEREECAKRAHPAQSAAARVAARQALSRALGKPVSEWDAWICADPRPSFHLREGFAAKHAVGVISVSLSHVTDYAGALVIVQGDHLR